MSTESTESTNTKASGIEAIRDEAESAYSRGGLLVAVPTIYATFGILRLGDRAPWVLSCILRAVRGSRPRRYADPMTRDQSFCTIKRGEDGRPVVQIDRDRNDTLAVIDAQPLEGCIEPQIELDERGLRFWVSSASYDRKGQPTADTIMLPSEY